MKKIVMFLIVILLVAAMCVGAYFGITKNQNPAAPAPVTEVVEPTDEPVETYGPPVPQFTPVPEVTPVPASQINT